MKFDLDMILTSSSRSRNIVYNLVGYEMHLSTKYEVNLKNGLGGVLENTYREPDRQTDRQTDRGP